MYFVFFQNICLDDILDYDFKNCVDQMKLENFNF